MRAMSVLAVTIAAIAIVAMRPAFANDKVDCSSLDLEFAPAAKADWTECRRIHYHDPDDDADGASAEIEILISDMGTHVVHIASVVANRNTYFNKVPVSQKLKNWDELEKFADVQPESDFGRYQVIRFRASLWKASVDCFGFIKYMGASITQGGGSYGAKGYVAGYDCWRSGTPDRAQIEAALDAIDN